MTFSYDEVDDFDETDDLDETDDFEEEPQDPFLEEDDDDGTDTALSQAFRQAAGTIDEDEIDEADEDDTEADDGTEVDDDGTEAEEVDTEAEEVDTEAEEVDTEAEEVDTEADDDTEEDNDADANTYEQQLIEPVEALPDENEDDLEEVELPPLELAPTAPEVEFFRPKEQSNAAYRDARTAYYEENDYQRAIEKFNEAIEYEVQSTEDGLTDANEIVAKSKYWQAEAYVKLQDLSQAIGTFEDLVKTCQGHYLSLAAQRRADQLNTKNS